MDDSEHLNGQSNTVNFRTLLRFITPDRRSLAAIAVLLMIGSGISLLNPLVAGQATGIVLSEPDMLFDSFGVLLLLWLGLIVFKTVLGFTTSYLISSTGENVSFGLRQRVYEQLQSLPLAHYQNRKSGDLLSLLTNDADIISGFVTNTVVTVLPSLVTFVGAFVIMFSLQPTIAILACILIPIYFLAMKFFGREIRPLNAAWIDAWSRLMSLAQENLGLMPIIKMFVREPVESNRFAVRSDELKRLAKREIWARTMMGSVVGLLAGAGLLLLLWIGYGEIQRGELAPSGLVSVMLYAVMLTGPVSTLANVYGQVLLTRGAAGRLLELFSQTPEILDEGKPPIEINHGAIEYRNVSFAYDPRSPVLTDFSLSIQGGETVALTGENGAGKSTLVHLLLRLMHPSSGEILIDGVDISEVDLHSLRSQIGLVAQHTLLLNGTVRDNIAYGGPGAEDADIKKAAIAARADVFIGELPDGYDTVIGDQGVKLSGGQRQRLSLARTLLRNPGIIILDEATSMFDPEGERQFIESCHDILEDRTVLLITHRPAGIALADRVLKIEPNGSLPTELESLTASHASDKPSNPSTHE